jgi:hypothetical protein
MRGRTPKPDRNGPVAPDGTRRGARVPGSRYYRDFCAWCRTPMRVTDYRILNRIETYCEICEPPAARLAVATDASRILCLHEPDWDAYALACWSQ